MQILSRAKPAVTSSGSSAKAKNLVDGKSSQQFEDYLNKRDYSGAITLLEARIKAFSFLELRTFCFAV